MSNIKQQYNIFMKRSLINHNPQEISFSGQYVFFERSISANSKKIVQSNITNHTPNIISSKTMQLPKFNIPSQETIDNLFKNTIKENKQNVNKSNKLLWLNLAWLPFLLFPFNRKVKKQEKIS